MRAVSSSSFPPVKEPDFFFILSNLLSFSPKNNVLYIHPVVHPLVCFWIPHSSRLILRAALCALSISVTRSFTKRKQRRLSLNLALLSCLLHSTKSPIDIRYLLLLISPLIKTSTDSGRQCLLFDLLVVGPAYGLPFSASTAIP
jgi:hypothetical protein